MSFGLTCEEGKGARICGEGRKMRKDQLLAAITLAMHFAL